MCIRDRLKKFEARLRESAKLIDCRLVHVPYRQTAGKVVQACLLYTSDAADERSSVDLGGRRIIKKKNQQCARENERNRRNVAERQHK